MAEPILLTANRQVLILLLLAVILVTGCSPKITVVEVTATPSGTPLPSITPTQTPSPTPSPTPTPPPSNVLLEPMNHQPQTFGNCVNASLAIVLGYFDHWVTQDEVSWLPDSSGRTGASLRQYQLTTQEYLFPPSVDPIRYILANEIPIIAGQPLYVNSDIWHYRVIHGYDDTTGEFIVDDPLLGANYRISYSTFFTLSHPSGVFFPIYSPEREPLVHELIEYHRVRQRGTAGCLQCHTSEEIVQLNER